MLRWFACLCFSSAIALIKNIFDRSEVSRMQIYVKHGQSLRARPKAERVFAEYENFLKLSDRPTDRDAFQRLISFEPSYRLTNGFRHLKATFNKSFVLA